MEESQGTDEELGTGVESVDYDEVGELLKTLFVDKLEPGSEPALIMKRYNTDTEGQNDGLEAFAEVVRYYLELTGNGLKDVMKQVNNPAPAKKDEDVMRCVERWEDDYKDAVKQGMPPLPDIHKITIIESIATEKLREKMEDEYRNEK